MSEATNLETPETEITMPKQDELVVSSSPHLHDGDNVPRIMLMVILALMPACGAGIYFFGLNALRVLVLCTFFCVAIEVAWCYLVGKPATWRDGSAALTGILLAMNLNAGMPWWVCLIGCLLAIILGKQLYGGLGYNPFNPALVARVGLLIAFPKMMTTWVLPSQAGRFASLDGATGATPLGVVTTAEEVIKDGGVLVEKFADIANTSSYWKYFIGDVGGCLGETSVVALLIGGAFLIALKLIRWQVPIAYIGTVVLFTYLINLFWPALTPGAMFHMLTGGLMLGAIFMATDMVTTPMTGKGALIFGFGCGVVTCVIRLWGNYPEGVSFSILFMNAFTPLIDRFTAKRPFGFKDPEKGESK